MNGTPTTPSQVRALLHDGKITKRYASRSISIMRSRNAGPFAPLTANLPRQCDCCGQSFWMDTLISFNASTLLCTDCAELL